MGPAGTADVSDRVAISGRIDELDAEAPRIDLTLRGDVDLALLEQLDDPGRGADILEKLLSDFPNLPRAEDIRTRMESLRSQIS